MFAALSVDDSSVVVSVSRRLLVVTCVESFSSESGFSG
jgi:hypothetical protein